MKLIAHNQRHCFGRYGEEKPYVHKSNHNYNRMPLERYHSKYSSSPRGYHPYYPPGAHYLPYSPNPTPWACDFCNKATFRTYQEANEHEKQCPMNPQARHTHPEDRSSHPPTNSRKSTNLQVSSKLHENRDEKKKCLSLAMPSDHESLSNRQCYVRSEFVELFTATESDVASRHSKGAQKLYVGQIGLRCRYCQHIPIRDRTERSVCYPSSISRIYQTVADMQRFHFEQCSSIPDDKRRTYKSLKTTRPRGVGSPQKYWIVSANELGLIDTPKGIRIGPKLYGKCPTPSSSSPSPTPSNYCQPISPCRRDPSPTTPTSNTSTHYRHTSTIPLSPATTETSQASTLASPTTTESSSVLSIASSVPASEATNKVSHHDDIDTSDANILLALRNTHVRTPSPVIPSDSQTNTKKQ